MASSCSFFGLTRDKMFYRRIVFHAQNYAYADDPLDLKITLIIRNSLQGIERCRMCVRRALPPPPPPPPLPLAGN